MYPSRTLSGKLNDPTVIAGPGCPAARPWPGEPWLPEFVHAAHSTASARQAARRTFRPWPILLIMRSLRRADQHALAAPPSSHTISTPHPVKPHLSDAAYP